MPALTKKSVSPLPQRGKKMSLHDIQLAAQKIHDARRSGEISPEEAEKRLLSLMNEDRSSLLRMLF